MAILGKRSRRMPSRPRKKARKITTVRYRAGGLVKQPQSTVVRTWWNANWTPSTVATTDFWKYFTFSLSNVPNVTDYTNVFDSFKVNWIKITLRPRYNSFAGNDTTDTALPGVTNQGGNYVHVIIDPKSQTVPGGLYTSSNLNTFLENGKVRTYQGMKPINILIKHPCLTDDINGTTGAKFVSSKKSFMSTTIANLPLRGAHVFIQDINMTGVFGQSYDIFYTMSATFKGMR